MSERLWKTLAIIFIVLFVFLMVCIIWGTSLVNQEEQKTFDCYYNVCADYPNAWYEESFCYCVDEDQEIAITKYMGN